jgi:GNAT superfamily N-acetyltransferase
MNFIRDIWGGHDYIPRVWDAWLSDERGKMFVVEAEGVPVGMSRVRFLEDGSAWLEGARVHPAFRGKGLASMLGENSVMFARGKGATLFRLTSWSRNRAAHRLIARIGFREVSRFSVYEPPKGGRLRGSGDVGNASATELRALMGLIERAKEFKLGSGVFWHDYAAITLTTGTVGKLISEGSVWRSGGAVAVAREGGGGSEVWEEVCFIGGPVADSMKLVRFLIGRRKGATERSVYVPHRSPIISALRKQGYRRNFSMILFERRAANG